MSFLQEYAAEKAADEQELDREMISEFVDNGYSRDLEEVELPEGITVNGKTTVWL